MVMRGKQIEVELQFDKKTSAWPKTDLGTQARSRQSIREAASP